MIISKLTSIATRAKWTLAWTNQTQALKFMKMKTKMTGSIFEKPTEGSKARNSGWKTKRIKTVKILTVMDNDIS